MIKNTVTQCLERTSSDASWEVGVALTNPHWQPLRPRQPGRPGAERTSKRRGLYTVSGSSMWPRWPGQWLKSCTQVEHTSLESAGPKAKSYRPFTDGFPRLSRWRGFVMDLTLNFLSSSAEYIPKEMPCSRRQGIVFEPNILQVSFES